MSKYNKKKTGFDEGVIAGGTTKTAGKYTDYELLRRVTLANLLFESNYYQSADTIMNQIDTLAKKVEPEQLAQLIVETRFEQKLRATPLWLTILLSEYHPGYPVKDVLAKIATRPDMLMDMFNMLKARNPKRKTVLPKGIKKGMKLAFANYDEYQLAKYKKSNLVVSLVDIVNLVHPKGNEKNAEALKKLVDGTLEAPDTWETNLSAGESKRQTFERLILTKKLGALATLRNLRNMTEAGLPRKVIQDGLANVNSSWLTPLNFLAAQRNAPDYTEDLNKAMERCFVNDKIKGTTILAIDVSGSMSSLTTQTSNFSRMDLAFALAALATYVFEDLILVFTAGSDSARKGKHMVWANGKGLGIFNDYRTIAGKLGGGGIFTHQLTKWLEDEGHAKNAERLIVLSDSQDIDVHYGSKAKPITKHYKHSYIIDISSHTHGIKTGVWTAEINGWSDALFTYVREYEKIDNQS